ncbi:MAG TPA: hypothetical protein GX497_01545 [Bacillus bacterium]|nr:hypothetical protein [Bacillus sp. (in: firmicutes)]
MGLFSKLFGKDGTKQQKEEHHGSALDLFIIYKWYTDNDEQADKYQDLVEELWAYDCIGAYGAMSSETAKQYGIPMPDFPEYPIIGVFDLEFIKGSTEGYTKPLFISTEKDAVKQFLKEYGRTKH